MGFFPLDRNTLGLIPPDITGVPAMDPVTLAAHMCKRMSISANNEHANERVCFGFIVGEIHV